MEELRSHPTTKPVALVADAIRDCTRRGDTVLDTFSGSGTTIMAAERVGRHAHAMEIEPRFVDVAIRRWQAFTRKDAVHAESGRTFDELAEERAGTPENPKGRAARRGNRTVINEVPKETVTIDERPTKMRHYRLSPAGETAQFGKTGMTFEGRRGSASSGNVSPRSHRDQLAQGKSP